MSPWWFVPALAAPFAVGLVLGWAPATRQAAPSGNQVDAAAIRLELARLQAEAGQVQAALAAAGQPASGPPASRRVASVAARDVLPADLRTLPARLARLEPRIATLLPRRAQEPPLVVRPGADLATLERALAELDESAARLVRAAQTQLLLRLIQQYPQDVDATRSLEDLVSLYATERRYDEGLEAIELHGSRLQMPAWKRHMLAIQLLRSRGDTRRAAELAQAIISDSFVPEGERASARYYAAVIAAESGAIDQAISGLQSLLDQYATSAPAEVAGALANARSLLASLRARRSR